MKRWDYTRDVTVHSFEYRVRNEEDQMKHVTVDIKGMHPHTFLVSCHFLSHV